VAIVTIEVIRIGDRCICQKGSSRLRTAAARARATVLHIIGDLPELIGRCMERLAIEAGPGVTA